MDRNPPANAGDTGSILGLKRFHIPWSNYFHVPQLLKPKCSNRDSAQPKKKKKERDLEHKTLYSVSPL